MQNVSQMIRVIAIAGALLASTNSHAQNAGASPKGEVVLVKLATPTYPPVAKHPRWTGIE